MFIKESKLRVPGLQLAAATSLTGDLVSEAKEIALAMDRHWEVHRPPCIV